MTDCIIVGSGVAGISAALTLQANGKNFLMFGSDGLSEKVSKAEKIIPGLPMLRVRNFYWRYRVN